MKAILMSINPKWVAKILNGKKTIEIRKKFSKDYVGWVYIYCTRDKKRHLYKWKRKNYIGFVYGGKDYTHVLDGKVVARFWCDKVEEIKADLRESVYFGTHLLGEPVLLKESCLSYNELNNYLKSKNGYAIHITKLEIFDKPKELKEFFVYSHSVAGVGLDGKDKTFEILKPLTNAPQSYCFIRDVL